MSDTEEGHHAVALYPIDPTVPAEGAKYCVSYASLTEEPLQGMCTFPVNYIYMRVCVLFCVCVLCAHACAVCIYGFMSIMIIFFPRVELGVSFIHKLTPDAKEVARNVNPSGNEGTTAMLLVRTFSISSLYFCIISFYTV